MQNIDALLRAINTLKTLSIAGDIVLPVAVIIALLIVYFYQRKRIEVLESYMDLWKPKDLEEQLKAYMELQKTTTKAKLQQFEKDFELERKERESLEMEKEALLKKHEERSELEKKYRVLTENALKSNIVLIQYHSVVGLISDYMLHLASLVIYADLGVARRYPGAPDVREILGRTFELEKVFSKSLEGLDAFSKVDIASSKEIPSPQKGKDFSATIDKCFDELRAIRGSYTPFLDLLFSEDK